MFELEADVQPAAVIKVVGVGGAGGNAVHVANLPPHARIGANTNAFPGGFRLWQDARAKHEWSVRLDTQRAASSGRPRLAAL